MESFRELVVYQKAYKYSLEIHKRSISFPQHEQTELGGQIRRASKSIPLNIVEGYGRQSKDEFKRFLRISLGSCDEMQVHLSFSKDLKYITEKEYQEISKEYEEIGRMLNTTIQKWK